MAGKYRTAESVLVQDFGFTSKQASEWLEKRKEMEENHSHILPSLDDRNKMPKVEYHEFIAVEKIGPVTVAFSNKPYCEFAFSGDEGIWTMGRVTTDKKEIITSPWQVCSDELGYLYLGTSKGNIYRGNIAYKSLGWALVNGVSFADDDPILYTRTMDDGTILATSKKGGCVYSLDRGLTWAKIQIERGTDALE